MHEVFIDSLNFILSYVYNIFHMIILLCIRYVIVYNLYNVMYMYLYSKTLYYYHLHC